MRDGIVARKEAPTDSSIIDVTESEVRARSQTIPVSSSSVTFYWIVLDAECSGFSINSSLSDLEHLEPIKLEQMYKTIGAVCMSAIANRWQTVVAY